MNFAAKAALAAAALTIAATPAVADYNNSVATGSGGSHVVGNPEARLKVIEYVSYTCSHCAHFQKESEGPLRLAYIPQGKVSIEVRHIVRDPIDLTATMLVNCGAPGKFYTRHNAFLQTQDTWIAKAQNASESQRQRWSTGPVPGRLRAIASDMGFYPMMEKFGVGRVAADQCLGDTALAKRVLDMTDAALSDGVRSTPSFVLNGELLEDKHSWDDLHAALQSRL
jgi:protein-disulfide isomerase